MSPIVSVRCPNCTAVVEAEPDDAGAKRRLRGREVGCDCGHRIDLYYY
ncbi:hypothetical protein ACFQPA_12500 [Halomarina halobia]|uniref:Uncharacterized protein n=1 Tax=Halomarina halobia TaxID=3033386 RepID=A0ABD6AAE1_9EURY|nr:hypothetical protein [Halomarina sp. PSR21]